MTREEAIEALQKFVNGYEKNICGEAVRQNGFVQAIKVVISALRPVSREQMILCKDCRYWQDNNGGYPHPECRWSNDETPDADDYCSFAERLEAMKDEKG